MGYDVVIVGAGISGLLCAVELAGCGQRVCIVEKNRVGRESSWAGGGILLPIYPWRYADPVNALVEWGLRHYPEFLGALHADTGIDPEWLMCGHLILDADADTAAIARWAGRFSVELESVRGRRLKRLEPGLSRRHVKALWAPKIGQVRSPRLLQALAAKAERLSIDIREDSALIGIQAHERTVKVVRTSSGDFAAGRVLITAGAWSGDLERFGLPHMAVRPVKGQMIQFQTPPGAIRTITLYRGHYVIPRKDGKVLAGSSLEFCGFNKATSAGVAKTLRQKAVSLFPMLQSAPLVNHWAGLRPGNDRQIPFIGQHPDYSNLFYNTGHYRNGIVLGLAAARLCGDLILGRAPILAPADYAWGKAAPAVGDIAGRSMRRHSPVAG